MTDNHYSIIHDPSFLRSLRIHNPDDRDDAIQDACVRLLSNSNKPPDPKLLRADTRNRYKDYVKRENRRKRREQCRAVAAYSEDLNDNLERWPGPRTQLPSTACRHDNPADRLKRHETRHVIKRAIRAARLSRNHRCALWAWLRDRVAEFARRRGVPETTVRVWVHRAIEAIRRHLPPTALEVD